MSMSTPLLDVALDYARRGWAVFPLVPRGKQPLTRHGLHDATTDSDTIGGWWRRWPRANVGLACGPSGLVVVDLDRDKGGLETWARLRRQHSLCDDTLTALTGGGGIHLFYADPNPSPGAGLRNSAGRLGPGVDVRAWGGYVVVPPSLHPNGRRYAWDEHNGPDALAPIPVPLALLPLLLPPPAAPRADHRHPYPAPVRCSSAYAAAALRGELGRVLAAPEGARNDTLNRAAFALGQLVGARMLDYQVVATQLQQAALATGLREREVDATIHSGLNAGVKQPRSVPPRAESGR